MPLTLQVLGAETTIEETTSRGARRRRQIEMHLWQTKWIFKTKKLLAKTGAHIHTHTKRHKEKRLL